MPIILNHAYAVTKTLLRMRKSKKTRVKQKSFQKVIDEKSFERPSPF